MAEAVVESPQPETSAGSGLALIQGTNNDCTPSPPPNCAICLGNCINNCFSDSCMHQFCFKCLLEWSKVKAVCPLCKQPFKSIIHNVKSNDEYDQHLIPQPASAEGRYEEVWRGEGSSRHFQFRTTLTVDPRGELAIQHLLSTRSMTNSLPQYSREVRYISDYMRTSNRRDVSSSQYRRYLYESNLYTYPMTDVTGRYRECSPSFYREYPGSKNRLVPFLQREINALLPDDSSSYRGINLVQRIFAAIDDHPIRGRYMKNMVRFELGNNTEHFLYEFYTYARSPFDLYGYDRNSHVLNTEPNMTEDSSDSDVQLVSVQRGRLNLNEVIEIGSESSHDSDVVVREPTPPVTVDLAVTTSSSDDNIQLSHLQERQAQLQQAQSQSLQSNQQEQQQQPQTPEFQMPVKLRQKSSRSSRYLRRKRRLEVNSTASETDSSTNTEDELRERVRKRPLIKIRKCHSSQADDGSSSDDMEHRAKRKRLRKKKHRNSHSKLDRSQSTHSLSNSGSTSAFTTTSTSTTTSAATSNYNYNSNALYPTLSQSTLAATACASANAIASTSVPGCSNIKNENDHEDVMPPAPHHQYFNELCQSVYPGYFPNQFLKSVKAYFHEQKHSVQHPDEAGPSGMSSNSQWIPKQHCSDSD